MNKVKLPSGEYVPVNDERIHIYRSLTGTAAVTASPYTHAKWDVSDSTITQYVDGMVVCIKVPVAGHGTYGTGLQINNLGYKPVVYNVSSMIGTRYSVGAVVWAVYNSTQTASLYVNSASASTITGCWQVMDYDSNTTSIYTLQRYNGTRVVSADLLRYVIAFRKNETTIVPIHSVAGTGTAENTAVTSTNKTMTTESFDPFGEIYQYATNTKIAANESVNLSALRTQCASVDARYIFNCNKTLTAQRELYLVVDLQSDGMVKLATSVNPWAQTLPSTNDGHLYILLGYAYSTYQLELYYYHPIYYHDGTRLRQYGGDKTFSGNYNDLTNKPTIPDAVSGQNDGTNWTSLTIGNTTKAIPQGGDSLPSQTGNSGKILTTDGTDASWAPLGSAIPTLTSPVSIWDLDAGLYFVPDGCMIYYRNSSSTSYVMTVTKASLLTVCVDDSGGEVVKRWYCWSHDSNNYLEQLLSGWTNGSDNYQSLVSSFWQRGSTNSADYDLGVRDYLSASNLNSTSYLSNGWGIGYITSSTSNKPANLSLSSSANFVLVTKNSNQAKNFLSANDYYFRQDLYLPTLNKHYYRIVKYYNYAVTANTSIANADAYGWVEVFETFPTLTNNAGKVLAVNSNADGVEWVTPSSGGSTTLSGLTDTTISSPSDGQVLTYDNATSKWVNSNIPTELPSITGNASKVLAVNSGATGVEWIVNSGGGGTTVTLPSGYSASTGITLSSSSLTTVATVGGVDLNLKAPASSGGLSDYDFTHTANTTVSVSTTTVTFAANQRGSVMLTISADLGLTIACNNSSDNYIWIKNTGSAEVDVTISAVTKNSTAVSNVYVPSDGITVPAGGLCEIGIIVNADGAFITSRNDLAL